MINLPFELYAFILRDVGLKDLINLRLTCKWLKFIVDNYYMNELVISSSLPDTTKWFYTNTNINYDNFIEIDLGNDKNFKIFKREIVEFNLFQRIKKLKLIFLIENHNYCITSYYLTKLKRLEQLDLCLRNYQRGTKEINITHPNLKILSIQAYRCKIRINCQNLEVLKHDRLNRDCKINYLNKIKYLSINSDTYVGISNLLKFKNLEHIVFAYVFFIYDFKNLLQLPKLKSITLENNSVQFRSSLQTKLNLIKEFILFKKAQSRDDVFIKFNNLIVSNLNDLINI